MSGSLLQGQALPAVIAALGALTILGFDALMGRSDEAARYTRRRGLMILLVATFSLIGAFLAAYGDLDAGLAAVSIAIVAVAGVLSIWLSSTYLMVFGLAAGEYFALLLLSLSGAFVALTASGWLTLYVGLELMALPAHVLAGFDKARVRGSEAAVKSFLLGALASAVLLFGLALLFGSTGQLSYAGVRAALPAVGPLGLVGLGLTLIGVALKAGLAPFHQWAPDVDEGSPTPVNAFIAVCVRGTALLVLLRLVVEVLGAAPVALEPIFAVLAGLGIAIGSAMALVQRNVKRLIAWAGVGHGGIMLLAFVAETPAAYGAMIFYLLAVGIATLGALGVVLTLAAGGREVERLEDLAGIGSSRPALAALMTLFLVGLAGLPVTVGFWAKFFLLRAVVDAGHVPLAVLALVGSVISLYAYMRIPALMYMRDATETETSAASTSEILVLVSCAVITVYLGVWPDPVLPGTSAGLIELLTRLSAGSLPM